MTSLPPLHPAVLTSLSMAIIDSSSVPLLLLDGDHTVLAISASFCTAFAIDAAKVADQPLSAIGGGAWSSPQLAALLRATASGFAEVDAYEMDVAVDVETMRKLVVNAHRLDYGDGTNVRLVVAVTDVTEERAAAKLKDELLREKATLLQELQHRVANSLQIVASVLMQSARKVQSDEAREHITDAHSRVMSIAALQTQLMTSQLSDVELSTYFTALCDSIGASMIRDKQTVSLTVSTDGSVTTAEVSISLGLVVTELVINALKHAFPMRPQVGAIKVDYRSDGDKWTLSVSDNGVGMGDLAHRPPSGLGTSIVAALARQLGATVHIANANPGTLVSIIRDAQPLPAARAL